MTKKQERPATRTRLDTRTVVRAALDLLDEKGADAVSVRGTADRLGVRMNTVLWHAKTKTRLLELMADAIIAEAPLDALPSAWDERVAALARRYRRALLTRRDGAAIVTGTYAAEPATLRFAEAMVEALLAGGLPEREAVWACWTVVYFALGLTQEEQALSTADGERFTQALAAGVYPSLARTAPHLRDASFDDRFEYGLTRILRSLH
ncbi:TetR/AcrR family transcriptional regulator C-terminal domain-containing protein [Streptomyces sp. NPDC050355]|uniref:TetR/AcrR family transcriptional regulator C-terminal domain-containing protein n=1 Tax=Streptomyces sp. NPDC050355 TaxID=3365609 RepID=UPI0037ADB52F